MSNARKVALRAAALAARRDLDGRSGLSRQACAHLHNWLTANHRGAVLAGYWPLRGEIDPIPVLAAHSGPACLPAITGHGQPLVFRGWHQGVPLQPGPFGTLQPDESAPEMQPEVAIVPLVAFDRRGGRLGYGGGFYDRTLETLRASGPLLAIGFAFAAQEVDAIPVEDFDQPLDLIVTEAGLLWPRPG